MTYPYLGRCIIAEKNVSILFNAENHGMVIQTDITDDERFAFGYYGEFDETYFSPLPTDLCVRISNDSLKEN